MVQDVPLRLYGVYGASGAGRGIAPLLTKQLRAEGDTSEVVFIDDGVDALQVNTRRRLNFEQFSIEAARTRFVAIAIADSHVRERLADRCAEAGFGFVSIFASEHVRMDDVEIGAGAIFSPFTTIASNIRIGGHFHCNINSYVEHDCRIGDFVTFAPGVCCNGNVTIGDHAYIGAGACIRQGITIGAGAIVGMGAVVVRDVRPGETVAGNPARTLERS